MKDKNNHLVYTGRHISGRGGRPPSGSGENSQNSNGNPNKNKSASDNKIYVGVLVFIVFVIYIAGYLFTYLNKPNVSVEIAQYGTIDMPKTLKGIVVRDEMVISADIVGELFYNYSEQEHVKIDSLIASVKNTDYTSLIEQQIADIDSDILKKQQMREDISFFASDIAHINGKIKNIVDNNVSKLADENASNIYLFKEQLIKEVDTRNKILLTDDKSSLNDLIQEKFSYENSLSNNIGSYAAPKSGILSYKLDGFEEVFTLDQLENLSEEQTKMTISIDDDLQKKSVSKEDPIFKIISSNDWYIVSFIPSDDIEDWEIGQIKNIYITGDEYDKVLAMEVFILKPQNKNTYVVLKSTKGMLDFINMRSLQFEIRDNVYNGIKIPNDAIIEKTMLKIPNSFIIENLEQEGVIKQGEVIDEFIPVIVKSIDEEEDCSYILQDMNIIKIGDIIKTGSEPGSSTYQISEVSTIKGVYVVNSSITEFKKIGEILVSNSDYSIIDKNNRNFYIQQYDRIVSDAKTVNDSEMIY